MTTNTKRAVRMGVMLIYQCNDGPVAYGPFAHVDFAIEWAKKRMGENDKFAIIPYHVPEYWDETDLSLKK